MISSINNEIKVTLILENCPISFYFNTISEAAQFATANKRMQGNHDFHR